MYKTILVPVDITEEELTQKVVPHVQTHALDGDAQVHFVAVITPMATFYEYSYLPPENLLPGDSDRAKSALEKLKEAVKVFGIPEDRVQCSVEIGAPRDRILWLAEEIKADLIIVASRRPNVSTYLLGSTASSVVRYAKTSVLVAR
ncbi:universal stress protein [Entomohabitans teleogrylli]|uniref:universal stress protein n=1 Tax=Entomohabitans teleogrylli TaxID=1384589 RepID=UPI00073D680F|nr:universal stress protein [Entomohabitans teleogrylli]